MGKSADSVFFCCRRHCVHNKTKKKESREKKQTKQAKRSQIKQENLPVDFHHDLPALAAFWESRTCIGSLLCNKPRNNFLRCPANSLSLETLSSSVLPSNEKAFIWVTRGAKKRGGRTRWRQREEGAEKELISTAHTPPTFAESTRAAY